MNENQSTIDTTDPIDMVAGLMVEGRPHTYIIDFLESMQIPKDEVVLIIEQALAKFVKSARMPAAVRKGWCLEALREIYRRLMSEKNYTGALVAVKEIAKLSALYASPSPDDAKGEINQYIDEVMTLS